MASVLMHDMHGLPNFDVSDVTGIASKWQRWRLSFELYATGKGIDGAAQLVLRSPRIVIPAQLHDQILQLVPEAHPGIVSMKSRLRSKVWWPGIDKCVEKFSRSC